MNTTTLRLIYLISFGTLPLGTLALCLDYTDFQFWCGVVGLACLGGSIIEMNWRK